MYEFIYSMSPSTSFSTHAFHVVLFFHVTILEAKFYCLMLFSMATFPLYFIYLDVLFNWTFSHWSAELKDIRFMQETDKPYYCPSNANVKTSHHMNTRIPTYTCIYIYSHILICCKFLFEIIDNHFKSISI